MDDNKIIDYYDTLLENTKTDFGRVGWGAKESQIIRFEVLSGLGDFSNKSVLDVGCGLGGLLEFFKGNGVNCDYHGIDINPRMVSEAQSKHGDNHFSLYDLMEFSDAEVQYDYVISSGALNIEASDSKSMVEDKIVAMLKVAKIGVGVNFLSELARTKNKGEIYIDPGKMLNFCLGKCSRVVALHNYMPHDVTFYLYKDR